MRLAVLTAAVFPSEEDARAKLWIFLKSATRAGVPTKDLHLYGMGDRFGGYRHLKLDTQLPYLLKLIGLGYSHVLYTDGWDAFFTAPLTEIIDKYERMGSPPMLVSAYTGFADSTKPDGFGDESEPRRYPHVGGYFAELPVVIDAFERMLQLPNQTGDDSFSWRDAWLEGWFRPVLDSKCQIFQVTDEQCVKVPNNWGVGGPRVFNMATGSHPCILHLAGGYTDQITGKDDRMIPWAKRLGVIE